MRMLLLLGVVTWHVTSSNAQVSAHEAFINSTNTFAINFFKAVVDNKSTNIICSPISASMVLWMVAIGAKGNTKKQLNSALALDGGMTSGTKYEIRSLVHSFRNYKEVDLRLANTIFLSNRFQPKAEFLQTFKYVFRSKAQSVDFRSAAEASKIINDWCAIRTNNRTNDLISAADLNSQTSLVLVNAVYFKGNWMSKFDLTKTKLRRFYVNETSFVSVPTMHRQGYYNFGNLDDVDATSVELPYTSNSLTDAMSMFIILPNTYNGLAELVRNFHKVTVERLRVQDKRKIHVSLPKFKIESSLDLRHPLKELGLGVMFNDAADFTGISGALPLNVRKVVQKVFIDVNEEGSEAAAATGVQLQYRSLGGARIRKFIVDRPFVSVIATESRVPLFSAIIVNPIT